MEDLDDDEDLPETRRKRNNHRPMSAAVNSSNKMLFRAKNFVSPKDAESSNMNSLSHLSRGGGGMFR